MTASEKIVWAFLVLVLVVIIAVLGVASAALGALATVGALILDVMYGAGAVP